MKNKLLVLRNIVLLLAICSFLVLCVGGGMVINDAAVLQENKDIVYVVMACTFFLFSALVLCSVGLSSAIISFYEAEAKNREESAREISKNLKTEAFNQLLLYGYTENVKKKFENVDLFVDLNILLMLTILRPDNARDIRGEIKAVVRDIAEKIYREKWPVEVILNAQNPHEIVVVSNPVDVEAGLLREYSAAIDSFFREVHDTLGCCYSGVYFSEPFLVEDVEKAYYSMNVKAKELLFYPEMTALKCSTLLSEEESTMVRFEKNVELWMACDNLKKELVGNQNTNTADKYISLLRKNRVSYDLYISTFLAIVSSLKTSLLLIDNYDDVKVENEISEIYNQYSDFTSTSDFEACVCRLIALVESKLQSIHQTRNYRRISLIDNLIKEHYSDPLFGVQQLADMVGLSSAYLVSCYTEAKGSSPKTVISAMRLESAERLLLSTDMSIEEIAARSGYANTNYFYRVFKVKYQVTPGHYREIHRIKSQGEVQND